MAVASVRLALATPLRVPLCARQSQRDLVRPLPLVSHRRSVITSNTKATLHPSYSTWATSQPTQTKKPRFSYNIAASFIAKDRPFDPSTHVFHFNPYNRIQPPRHQRSGPYSRPESGHDAFFASRVNETGSVAFGVADGVGGWTDMGIDPADFSHGFCDYMASAAWEYQLQEQQQQTQAPNRVSKSATTTADTSHHPVMLSARKLMQLGYDAICADGTVLAGSSTACVAVAGPDGDVNIANLGDSGFLQLRLNAVHSYSEAQTHGFNTPFQLSIVPRSIARRSAAYGGAQLCDLPRDADVSQHRLRHGDVLIMATDGVFDNLFNQDILRIASRVMMSADAWSMNAAGEVHTADNLDAMIDKPLVARNSGARAVIPPGKKPERAITLQSLLATELVLAAKRASVNTKQDGPFAKEVQKYYPNERYHGGKVDDICVVVVVVTEDGVSGSKGGE